MKHVFNVGDYACIKWKKEIVQIIEVFGFTYITTGGSYEEKDLESLSSAIKRIEDNKKFADNVLKKIIKDL